MLKAFRYRMYPTDDQKILLNKHIGASRFIYNLALETKQMAWSGNKINLSCFDLTKQLPDLKNDCEWLREINSQTLQQSIFNLDNAFTRFFKGQSAYPIFKKKSAYNGFNVPQNIKIDGDLIKIPKFTEGIRFVLHRNLIGTIRNANIKCTSTGKYFVSILCETNVKQKAKPKVKESTTIGIDLGIKTFLVSSNGQRFDNQKYLRKAQSKLKYIQSKYARFKGKRTKQKLALLHEKIANQRKDFLHKISSIMIRDNQSIAIEYLNISGMIKNHNLAQAIADVSWSEFIRMLEYKSEWYGRNIIKIGRFEPSSKMCSACGRVNKELTLKDREWTCICGTNHDRDINAAINIKNFALRNYLSVGRRLKNQNELPTMVGVMTSEAHSSPLNT